MHNLAENLKFGDRTRVFDRIWKEQCCCIYLGRYRESCAWFFSL